MSDLRETIKSDLAAIAAKPLRGAAIGLLSSLGYKSDRTLNLGNSSPATFLDFIRKQPVDLVFNEAKALFSEWKSADLLFQLSDEELSNYASLFKETDVAPGLLRSYLFFAIELTGADYPRGKLTGIARQLNRIFPMPVMVLIKHVTNKKPVLSIAVINRRQNKRDAVKDVLGKVTIIRDIALAEPHRGHLDILASFAVLNLVHPQRLPVTHKWIEWGTTRAPALFSRPTFKALHETGEKILVQRSPGPDPKCCYDDMQLHFTESSVGFVPWRALEGVRNNSLKKTARYRGEKPSRPDLPKREELEATSRNFAVKYLLGVMNSGTARDFLRANRRSNIHLYPDDWKKLPIPNVPPAQQQPIVDLVERILIAKRASITADVTALEAELDAKVATLYGTEPTS